MTILNYYINYVDIIFAFIIIIVTVFGCKKGLFVTMLNFIRYVFGFSASLFVANSFSQSVYEKYVRPSLIDYVNNNIVKSDNINDTIANFNNSVSSIPRDVRMMFGLENAQIIKTDDLANSIVDNILQPISLIVTKIVLFIAILVVINIIFRFISHRIIKRKKRSNKSVTKKFVYFVDCAMGGVFGLVKAVLLLFLIISIISIIITNAPQELTGIIKEADESYIYNLLIDYNPFNLITEGILWVS